MVYEESACGSHRLKCSSLAAIFALEKELKSLYMVQFDLLKTCRISVWIRPAGHGWAHHHWPQWVSNFASLDQVSLASGLDTESPARTMDMTNAFTCGVQDKTCIKCASGGYNYSEWVYKATYNWGPSPYRCRLSLRVQECARWYHGFRLNINFYWVGQPFVKGQSAQAPFV